MTKQEKVKVDKEDAKNIKDYKMPKENQMNFCPKCGKELVEELEK